VAPCASDREPAFAVWLTGLPASGKSTVARALAAELAGKGSGGRVPRVRRRPSGDLAATEVRRRGARKAFYATLAYLARCSSLHGVPVIVPTPTAKPQGITATVPGGDPAVPRGARPLPAHGVPGAGSEGNLPARGGRTAKNVPGVSATYEAPLLPEVVVDGERDDPAAAARRIVSALKEKGFLPHGSGGAAGTR